MKPTQKLSKKINQLKNLKSYLNIYFQQTLSQIKGKNKQLTHKINSAHLIKNLFGQIEEIYRLRSPFYDQKPAQKGTVLYILISEKIKLAGINKNRLNQTLLTHRQNYDNYYLITIGDWAQKFAKQQQITPLYHFPNNLLEHGEQIKLLIYEYYCTKKVSEVVFFLNSNRLVNNTATILPAKKLVIRQMQTDQSTINLTTLKIYPNLLKMVEMMEMIYLHDLVEGLLSEAAIYPLKQKLAKLNQKMHEIDQKIYKTIITANRLNSDQENEELLLLAQ